MDGNGRWAAKRGLPRPAGHKAGADNLRKIMDACRNRGIRYATFFAFSTENWKRPKEEVDALMRLFYDYLDEADRFTGKKARIMFLGSKEPFPEKLRERMIKLEQNSSGYDSMTTGTLSPRILTRSFFRECFTQVQHPMPTLSYAPAAS